MRNPGSPKAVRRSCFALLGLGLALAASTLVLPPQGSLALVVALTAVLFYSHLRAQRLVSGHGSETSQPDEMLLVPMLVLCPPLGVLAGFLVSTVAQGFFTRMALHKIAFNAGQFLVSATAALWVCHGLCELTGGGMLAEILGAVVGTVVFSFLSNLLVNAIIAYSTGGSYLEITKEQGWSLLPLASSISVGALGVALAEVHLGLLVLLAFPLVLVQRTQRLAYAREQSRARIELMYEAAQRINASADAGEVRTGLLEGAREVLGARESGYGPTPDGISVAFAGEQVHVSGRVGGGEWDDEERTALRSLGSAAEAALVRTNLVTRMRTLTESQSEAVIAVDASGHVTFANRAALRLCGWTSETIGRPIRETLPLDDLSSVEGAVAEKRYDSGEGLLDGAQAAPVAWSTSPVDGGEEGGAVIVLRDITEEQKYRDHLTRLAYEDDLTGLYNRSRIVEELDRLNEVGVILLDLERFHLVNDAYGHEAGDALLETTARRLREVCGDLMLGRIAGDEFCIVVPGNNFEKIEEIAHRSLAAVSAPHLVDGTEIHPGSNAGIATSDGTSIGEDLLAAAGAAVTEAKRSGVSPVTVHSGRTVTSEARERIELEGALRQGISQGELLLHYQPIVDAVSGTMVGVEALVRWMREGALVSPGVFIPLAEESGLIVEIGNWVMEEACRQVNEWNVLRSGRSPLYVSVNVATRQFAREDVVSQVEGVLERTGLPAGLLYLEVTEGSLMDDTPATVEKLTRLRGLGLKVAMDDFGTGYSSLSYLQRFPMDVVKVDQSFVRDLGSNRAAGEIVAAIVRLSQAVGMGSVAEGVETVEQWEILKALGCDRIQGYLYSRPLPQGELLEYWDEDQAVTVPGQRSSVEDAPAPSEVEATR